MITTMIAILHDKELNDGSDSYENTFKIVEALKPNPDEVDSIICVPLKEIANKLNSTESGDFSLSKLPIELTQENEISYFTKLFGDIPSALVLVMFTINGGHLLYGFNSMHVLITILLADQDENENQLELKIDETLVVNRNNVIDFVCEYGKCSYLSFIKRKNEQLLKKNDSEVQSAFIDKYKYV